MEIREKISKRTCRNGISFNYEEKSTDNIHLQTCTTCKYFLVHEESN